MLRVNGAKVVVEAHEIHARTRTTDTLSEAEWARGSANAKERARGAPWLRVCGMRQDSGARVPARGPL